MVSWNQVCGGEGGEKREEKESKRGGGGGGGKTNQKGRKVIRVDKDK